MDRAEVGSDGDQRPIGGDREAAWVVRYRQSRSEPSVLQVRALELLASVAKAPQVITFDDKAVTVIPRKRHGALDLPCGHVVNTSFPFGCGDELAVGEKCEPVAALLGQAKSFFGFVAIPNPEGGVLAIGDQPTAVARH